MLCLVLQLINIENIKLSTHWHNALGFNIKTLIISLISLIGVPDISFMEAFEYFDKIDASVSLSFSSSRNQRYMIQKGF